MGSFILALMDPLRSPSSARRPNLSIQPEMCGASGREAAAGSTATFVFPGSGGVTVCVPHAGRYSAERDKTAALIVPLGTPTLPRIWRCGISIRSGHTAAVRRRRSDSGSSRSSPVWIPDVEAAPGRRAGRRCRRSGGDRAASPVRLRSGSHQN